MITKTVRTRENLATLPSAAPMQAHNLLSRLVTIIGHWRRIAAERRALAAADDAMLRDIGLSREQAAREAARPFWDARPPG